MKNGTKKILSVLLAALFAVPAMTVSAAADAPKEKNHAVVHEKAAKDEKAKQKKEEKNLRFSPMSFAEEAAPMLMTAYAAPLSEEDDTAPADTVYVGETELSDGEWTADGLTESTGTLPASGYAYYNDGVLTLNNFEYEGEGYLWDDEELSVPIYRDGSLKIELEGSNALTTEATEYYYPLAICAESLTISGTKDSTLNLEACYGIYSYGGNVDITDTTLNIHADDCGIYNKGALTISGSTVNIETYYYDGIYAYDNVSISGSTVNIDANNYGIYSYYGNISIKNQSIVDVHSYSDSICAEYGTVFIDNSTANIISEDDDGIYGYNSNDETDNPIDISITNSTVTIDASCGLDVDYIYSSAIIQKSTVTITATEYGIEADRDVSISGSTVNIDADDDGIYANGNVSISGSTVNIASEADGIYTYVENDDSYEYTGGDVSIKNSTLNIEADYHGISTYSYVENADGSTEYTGGDVSIENSTVNIDSYDTGIYTYAYISSDDGYEYTGDISIENSTVDIDACGNANGYEDAGIYAYGKVFFEDSTVNIDTYYDDGIYANGDVSISGSTVNIDADDDGIYANVSISGDSSEITIISGCCAISADYVTLDNPLELLYPAGGSYSSPAIYIAADPDDHDCTTEKTCYYFDTDGHWKVCANPNCPIPKRAEFGMDYEEHYLYEEGDTCETCGETYSNLIVGNHYLSDGEYRLNNGAVVTGTPSDTETGYAYYKAGVLTLNNYINNSNPYNAILCKDDLTIVLKGENKLTSEEDTVDIDGNLTVNGSGSLEIDSGCCGLYAYSEENSYDILLEGVSLTIHIDTDAVDASGNITIKDSKLTVIAGSDGIDATEDITIFESKLTITAEDEGLDADENITVTDSELTIISEDEGLDADKNITVTNSTLTLTTDEDSLDYAGIYADTVEITDSTVTINSNCHGIYTYDSSSSYEELSDEVSDETAESGADIIITRSNVTIDAAYYALRSETGITLIDCELPEGMEIAVVDDEYEDSSEFIPVMLSLTSEITDESNAGESTEEFENPVYTVVNADKQAVHHLVITYNKSADDTTEPTEDTASPIPNLTGIRLIENGKTKTLPSAIGSRRTLTFTPAEGYCVADVLVNGKSVGAVEKYTVVTVPGITVEVIYEELEG